MRHITAAFAFAGICVLGAACSSNPGTSAATSSNQGTSAATGSTRFAPVSFGAAPPAAPASPAALAGLLLSPAEAGAALGTTAALTDQGDWSAMADVSANVTPKECVFASVEAQATPYAGSGYTALRVQLLQDGPIDTANYAVHQAVVSFPSATAASAFFTASAPRWQACANTTFTYVQTGQPDAAWGVGPVTNTSGILSTIATDQGGNGWGCERALTVANNVAIDINACSTSPSGEGVAVAQKIAAKVSAQ